MHRCQDTVLRLIKRYTEADAAVATGRIAVATVARWSVAAVVAVTAATTSARIARTGGLF